METQKYDIAVIGSGLGGLSAAALLARGGYRVVVAERLPRVGGRCSTVDYQGFKCTTGVIGPETGGILQRIFDTVGAEFDVRPAGPPHYLIRGEICPMPDKGGLHMLLSKATDDTRDIDRVMTAVREGLKGKGPPGDVCLRDWLFRHTQNEAVLGIFQAMTSAATFMNADELPAGDFFAFMRKMKGVRDFGFCPRGSIALAEALRRVIEESGGAVWTRTPAVRITTQGGAVSGAVVRKEGREIELHARVVVSNCGPRGTMDLVGKEDVAEGYRTELEGTVRPAMVIAIHIGAEEPLMDLNYLLVTGARRVNAIFQPTRLCPELAPPGKHYLLAGAAPASSMAPLKAKEEVDLCMQDLRELLPGFERHARILLTGTYHGAWPAMHSWPGRDMPLGTPIRNLYNVGDGVKSFGMVAAPAAAETGLLVAEEIQRKFKPGMA